MEQDRAYFQRRLGVLRNERSSFIDHWRDLSDNVSPRTSRFLATDRQKQGYTRNSKIYDNTATTSLRLLSSGMMGGITSPTRPWFQLRCEQPDLNDAHNVKLWLDTVRDRMMEAFLRSNVYTVLPQVYSDLGLYGTSAFAIVDHPTSIFRAMHFPIGSYMLASSNTGAVNACYREYQMTVGQLAEQFGEENLSESTRAHYKNRKLDTWIDVVHAVEPNQNRNDNSQRSDAKPWRSVYYELAGSSKDGGPLDDRFLSDMGFDEFPIVAPRWQTIGEDIYGISPGMEALSDIKMLQVEQKRKLQAIDKLVTPPMVGPVSLKNKRASVLSGDITYIDTQSGGQKFEQAYQVGLRLQELMLDIQETQSRIKSTLYTDLFMMIATDQRSNVTAFEIAARQEEKLLALGPVYLRLNDELLDPLVDRVFNMLARAGEFPIPPEEIQGTGINVEYISVMAQSMKAAGVVGIERVVTFAGNMSQAFPGVLDLLDGDEALTDYADMIGVSPKLLRDDRLVAQIRQQRAQQAEQDRMMAAGAQAAESANQLANAPMGDDNALSQLMQRMQVAQGA